MQATPASLKEAISYGDFSQEVQLQQLAVQEQLEDAPDENLLKNVLRGSVKILGSTMHTIGTGKLNILVTYQRKQREEIW